MINFFRSSALSLFLLLFSGNASSLWAQEIHLRDSIQKIACSLNADVGVSIIDNDTNDTLSLNGDDRFPRQSVFKFHIALVALHLVDEGKLSLDATYHVTKEQYFETWSVLMRMYPDADVNVTLKQLITWSVMNSDNIACDILLDILGGPVVVQQYINDLGVVDIAIVANEQLMHKDWNVQFSNWTTPNAAASLLKLFLQHKILSEEQSEFLWNLMVDTPNAPQRLKGRLPKGTVVARKPGTGASNGEIIGAVNDVGIILLPNGKKIIIAIFVTRAKGEFTVFEKGIAEISRTVFEYFSYRR